MIFYENKSNHLYCWYGKDLTFPPHLHKELEILMVTKGEIELTINSTTQILQQGDISFTLPNTIHGYKTLGQSDHFIIIFNGDMLPLFKTFFSAYRGSKNYVPGAQVTGEVYSSLSSIHRETQLENNIGILTGYLYITVSRLLPFLGLQKSQKDVGGDLVERILSYIQANYLNQINLLSIANALHISPFYLSRVFSNSIGLRLDKYINELRINYANHLLISTNKQITEISFECGFETLRTFNRTYKTITSLTPREYRNKNCNIDRRAQKNS
ncbi:MAG: helix-turn-helix transcriptional regulator [Ruminiclostridium sp.]